MVKGESTYAKTLAYYQSITLSHDFNGVTMIGRMTISDTPVGHFVTGYDKAIRSLKAIKEEAERKQAELIEQVLPETPSTVYFYRAVAIVCEG